MEITTAAWVCICALIFVLISYAALSRNTGQKKRLPPSPPSLPVIGHLHLLSDLPNRDLARLSARYGPLFFLRLGSVNCVVVSSAQMALEFLRTHDAIFASRPSLDASRIICYNSKDIAFAPYGEHWKLMRKICSQELFTSKKLQSSMRIRAEEISCTLQSILDDSLADRAVNFSSKLSSHHQNVINVITRIAFGKRFFGEESAQGAEQFRQMIRETFFLAGAFNVGDYLPFLSRFDLQGYRRRMEAVHLQLDAFLNEILEEEIQKLALGRQDESDSDNLVSVLLKVGEQGEGLKLEHEAIKGVIQDVILGGIDTTSVNVEWALAELLESPGIMQKAQEELDNVIGFGRSVEENDIPNLPFLQAIVKESLRLHSGFLVPHESIAECKVAGYDIPKGTRLMVSLWQMGRDSNVWKNPEVFYPDRFIGKNIDVKGRDFEFIPFGSGRRICLGLSLGLTMVHIVLARLLHSFDWVAAEKIDFTEKFGLTMPLAKPLLAFAKPRRLMSSSM